MAKSLKRRRRKAHQSRKRETTLLVIGLIVLLLGGWLGWSLWRGANATAAASSGVVGTNVDDSATNTRPPIPRSKRRWRRRVL